MKIVTWNIGEDERHQNGVAGIDTYEYIANFIIENEIDIVCFEEAIISFDKLEPIGKYIKMHTDLKYVEEFNLSDSHINLGAKMGVVVCSKYELTIDEKIMTEQLYGYIKRISNMKIYTIVKYLFDQHIEKLRIYPAASKNHHEYVSGLEYHTLSMLKIGEALLDIYPQLNKDFLQR